MARGFFINGESLVLVKGRTDSAIGSLAQLGLSEQQIHVQPVLRHKDANVDAVGQGPADVQFMYSELRIRMSLIHVDRSILDTCLQLSMGGAPAIGQTPRAGSLMGNGLARFVAGNNYIGLNIASPVGNKPWRFYFAYLADNPWDFPLGTEKSIIQLNWRVVPYIVDPWNSGSGTTGNVIWDHVLDV